MLEHTHEMKISQTGKRFRHGSETGTRENAMESGDYRAFYRKVLCMQLCCYVLEGNSVMGFVAGGRIVFCVCVRRKQGNGMFLIN